MKMLQLQDILIMMLLIGATAAVKDSQGTSPVTTQANMTTTTTQNPLTTTQGKCGLFCNNGTCSIRDGNPICTCEYPYIGDQCAEVINACNFAGNQHRCGHHVTDVDSGHCISSTEYPYWSCNCTLPYYGPKCNRKHCKHDIPCSGNGECAPDTVLGYKCTCDGGYSGLNCTDHVCGDKQLCGGDTHECDPKTKKPYYNCACRDGYNGTHCENDPCVRQHRCVHGNCSLTDKPSYIIADDEVIHYTCECKFPYTGQLCQTSPCDDNTDCGLKGECREKKTKTGTTDLGYYCECNHGYTGAKCEEAITTTTTTPTTTATTTTTTTRITKTKSTSHGTEETTENDGKTPTNTDNPLPTHAEETTENDGKTPTNTDNPLPAHAGPNIGVIIGSILAVAVVVIALIGFGRWYRQKRRAEQRKKKDVIPLESVATQALPASASASTESIPEQLTQQTFISPMPYIPFHTGIVYKPLPHGYMSQLTPKVRRRNVAAAAPKAATEAEAAAPDLHGLFRGLCADWAKLENSDRPGNEAQKTRLTTAGQRYINTLRELREKLNKATVEKATDDNNE